MAEHIATKEAEIKALPDQRWYRLAEQRRGFVEQEKNNAEGRPYAADLKAAIDQGYLNLLDCILTISG